MSSMRATTFGPILAAAALGIACHAQAGIGGSDCVVFTNKDAFEQFNAAEGKLLKGIEDFEHGIVPPGAFADLVDPLEGNVPNVGPAGLGFPEGLINKNLKIQSNHLGENAPFPAPGAGLRALGPNFLGLGVPNSIVVGTRYPQAGLPGVAADSLDLIFDAASNHTGVGFDVIDPTSPPRIVHITVFDKNELVIFKGSVPGTPQKFFFGIWCQSTIGRINLAGESSPGANNGAEYVDNIQMWEEAQVPTCPWDCGLPHNKIVDVIDLLKLLAEYDVQAPLICDGGTCDFNGDGCVDVNDLLKLLAFWGLVCPPPVNDECTGKIFIDRIDPEGTIVEHFDMYGATPSPEPYKCIDIVPQKDIWYCLINATGVPKGVTVSSTVNLLIEVNAGCTCPPGPLVACGVGLEGTPQFVLQPGEAVNIRLINAFNLPNDVLKGDLIIDNKTIVTSACPTARIDFGVTPDDGGNTNACPGPISITTQYQMTQSIVFGTAVDNFSPPDVVIIDVGACLPSCRSSGTPIFTGPWWCQFRIATGPADIPAGVTSFSAELCFIDAPGSVIMEGYNNARVLIASAATTVPGTEVVTITAPAADLIAYVHIGNTVRPAGVSVDCLNYPDPIPREPGDDVNFYTDPALFNDALQNANKVGKFFWDFKPDFLPPGASVPIVDPLDIFTHPINAPGVWFGPIGNLWPPDVDNVQFWSNATPQGPLTPAQGLLYAKLPDNNTLVARLPGPPISFDILSGPPAGANHTAFALDLISIGSPLPPVFHVTVYDKQDLEIGKFTVSAPTMQAKVFLGILSKDNAITIGRIDIWDVNGGMEGVSAIAAFFRPANPFGCPAPGDCCVAHNNPACDNEDCCRRVCSIDTFCCTVAWDQICVNEAATFPQCGCVPVHDLEPCLPGGCPPGPQPEWCVYEVTGIQDPFFECKLFGIFPGQIFCVAPCPFPGDPVACAPNFPQLRVDFRVVGTSCVINCVPLNGCEPCPPGNKQWRRIN